MVKIEQNFQISRQALLCRLEDEKLVSQDQIQQFKQSVINSAIIRGFDDKLYRPTPQDRQYMTYGNYISLVETLKQKELISTSKYESLMLDAFRSDIVYNIDNSRDEIYD